MTRARTWGLALALTGTAIGHAQSPTAPPAAAAEEQAAEETGTQSDSLGRAEFLHGREAYGAGRYEEALEAFGRSYSLTGRKALLYNIGLAHDRLRHDSEALAAFREYLEHTPDSPFREQVEGRIAALDQAVTAERAQAAAESARQAAIEAELERARQDAEDARLAAEQARTEEEPKRSLWWVGVIVGVVVVGAGVGLGVALSGDSGPQFAHTDFRDVSRALRVGP